MLKLVPLSGEGSLLEQEGKPSSRNTLKQTSVWPGPQNTVNDQTFPFAGVTGIVRHFRQHVTVSCSHVVSMLKSPLLGLPLFSDKSLSSKIMQLTTTTTTRRLTCSKGLRKWQSLQRKRGLTSHSIHLMSLKFHP